MIIPNVNHFWTGSWENNCEGAKRTLEFGKSIFFLYFIAHISDTERERESVRTKYVSGTPTQTLRYEMWAYQMAC